MSLADHLALAGTKLKTDATKLTSVQVGLWSATATGGRYGLDDFHLR